MTSIQNPQLKSNIFQGVPCMLLKEFYCTISTKDYSKISYTEAVQSSRKHVDLEIKGFFNHLSNNIIETSCMIILQLLKRDRFRNSNSNFIVQQLQITIATITIFFIQKLCQLREMLIWSRKANFLKTHR